MFGLTMSVTVTASPPMTRAKSATWVVVATTASFCGPAPSPAPGCPQAVSASNAPASTTVSFTSEMITVSNKHCHIVIAAPVATSPKLRRVQQSAWSHHQGLGAGADPASLVGQDRGGQADPGRVEAGRGVEVHPVARGEPEEVQRELGVDEPPDAHVEHPGQPVAGVG